MGECKGCAALREQNEYLRKQNNVLLMARGIMPVITGSEEKEVIDPDDEKHKVILENAEIVMGGDD